MNIIEHGFTGTSPRKKTTEIILHCAATPEGKDYTVDQINKWHKDRGFNNIGYNYVIYRDGSIHRGRPEKAVGAHCTNHNSISVGICYIGGLDATTKKGKDTRTAAQKQSMYELVDYLMGKYGLKLSAVHGHYEFANKSCPAFKIDAFRKEFEEWKGGNSGSAEHVCPTCGQVVKG